MEIHNIGHFTDNLLFYLIKNDIQYPPINDLMFIEVDTRSLSLYNSMILKFITRNIKYKNIFFQPDILRLFRKLKNEDICFKTIHLIIRSKNGAFLGLFRSYKTRIKFRDEGYKYLRITPEKDIKKEKICITIIVRKTNKDRRITNLVLIKNMIKSMKYEYEEVYFDGKLPIEQILMIINAKIILTPFGAGIINVMWIVSPKVLIINCMSTYVMADYNYFAYSVGYRIISLFSLHHLVDPLTFDEGYREKFKFSNTPCVTLSTFFRTNFPLHKTNGDNMTISTNQIRYSIYYGLMYLKTTL